MAEDGRITLVIEGLPEDNGRVRFPVFLAELQSLNATINRLDREANAGKQATNFRIAELSYSSPIRVVLEPQRMRGEPETIHAVIQSLNRIAAAFVSGGDLDEIDADLLDGIRSMAAPVGKEVRNATLLFDDNQIDLTPQIASRVTTALAVAEECDGSIEGMLEQINIHLGANTFHIYPEVGPRKVSCRFPRLLYDDAVSAVGRRVEVSGTLRYRARATFPHEIAVARIEAYPPEQDLPDWEDLRGRAPDATGGLSSEAFVRELRDGWR
jgi:hypothetical protein